MQNIRINQLFAPTTGFWEHVSFSFWKLHTCPLIVLHQTTFGNSTTQKRESLAAKANKKGEEGGLKKTETVGQNHSAERTQGFSVGTVSNRQVSKKKS